MEPWKVSSQSLKRSDKAVRFGQHEVAAAMLGNWTFSELSLLRVRATMVMWPLH